MSNIRYIEVNSNYRDRVLWSQASEFEIPISQTGTKSITNAIDPVSLSMPIFSWTSNNLSVNGNETISGNIGNKLQAGNISYSSDTSTFVITSTLVFQQLRNYYSSLIIKDIAASASPNPIRRIATSYYLGISSGNYRTEITIVSQFSDNVNLGDAITIFDPTDFSDPSTPLIFVPNGALQENAYNNYILYNETINQFRPIYHYDNITDIIQLDTKGSTLPTNSSGPIDVSWQTTDNFSLRTISPIIPKLGGINPSIISGPITYNIPNTTPLQTKTISTTANLIIITGSTLSSVIDFYKNEFLRVLPYGDPTTTPTDIRYEYYPIPTNNQACRITSYKYYQDNSVPSTYYGIFTVYPGFNLYDSGSGPGSDASIEILPFSYDNFNPFVYTGSLVSQQDMVCYEMQLISLTLPNYTLSVSQGGRVAFYPYLYVQISNVSATGAGLKNIIYSNNPNSTSIIFRAPIYDVQNPLSTPFVRIDGEGMTQTIKFKPNDNLYFKVTMSTGENYQTILSEYYSPSAPNPMAQITALFSFKRIN